MKKEITKSPCPYLNSLCDTTGPLVFRTIKTTLGRHPSAAKKEMCTSGGVNCPVRPNLQRDGEKSLYAKTTVASNSLQ